MIRVLISASSPVVRAGLEALVPSNSRFAVTSRPYDSHTFVNDVDAVGPDVVVLAADQDDDDVIASVATVLSSPRPPAIIAIRDRADSTWVADALHSGMRAVLPHDVSAAELRAAIDAAAAGLTVLTPEAQSALLWSAAGRRTPAADGKSLTPREVEVLQMLAGGLGNKAIAQRLGISTHTVKYHVGSIMTRLGAASRTEAVTIGVRQGLILL